MHVGETAFVPGTTSVDHVNYRKHHRYLDQHPHDRGERRTGFEAEKPDGCRHGKFKEI